MAWVLHRELDLSSGGVDNGDAIQGADVDRKTFDLICEVVLGH